MKSLSKRQLLIMVGVLILSFTLLYASFNETRSVDLRHYTDMTIRAYIDRYQPDVVIYVRDETTYFSTEGNGNLA